MSVVRTAPVTWPINHPVFTATCRVPAVFGPGSSFRSLHSGNRSILPTSRRLSCPRTAVPHDGPTTRPRCRHASRAPARPGGSPRAAATLLFQVTGATSPTMRLTCAIRDARLQRTLGRGLGDRRERDPECSRNARRHQFDIRALPPEPVSRIVRVHMRHPVGAPRLSVDLPSPRLTRNDPFTARLDRPGSTPG